MLRPLPGIKVHSVENPDLTDALLLKPGVGQNVAMHATPRAANPSLDFSVAKSDFKCRN